MPDQLGQMRHRIEIQAYTTTRDANGGVVKAWTTAATRWGSINPLSAREYWLAQQTQSQTDHEVWLRYYEGLTSSHRLKFGSRIFNITAVTTPAEVKDKMRVLCKEEV